MRRAAGHAETIPAGQARSEQFNAVERDPLLPICSPATAVRTPAEIAAEAPILADPVVPMRGTGQHGGGPAGSACSGLLVRLAGAVCACRWSWLSQADGFGAGWDRRGDSSSNRNNRDRQPQPAPEASSSRHCRISGRVTEADVIGPCWRSSDRCPDFGRPLRPPNGAARSVRSGTA